MYVRSHNPLLLTTALAVLVAGCSASDEQGFADNAGAPGSLSGTGGTVAAGTGGAFSAGGMLAGVGGALAAGGTVAGIGGEPGVVGSGGAVVGAGGAPLIGSGGDINVPVGGSGPVGVGGLPSGSGGGTVPGSGGSVVGSGGALPQGGTGGTAPTGGSAGEVATGGAPGTGGALLTGGTAGSAGFVGEGGTPPVGGAAGTGGQTSVGACSGGVPGGRIMECLDRGVVAVNQGSGTALVSWRLFGTDPDGIGFNVYREVGGSATQICSTGPTEATNCIDSSPSSSATYFVRPVLDGQAGDPSGSGPYLENGYLSIPLQDAGDSYVHLAWVGDLDGDGELDYVVDRIPNTEGAGMVDAYRRNGTFLWRIDLGPNGVDRNNIEGGPTAISNGHWDGLTVFDFDSDGRAEVAIKTANGGDYFGDWREEILMEGPNHNEIRIFATGYETDLRLYTLLHNPEYRNCLTVHGYRQSTMVDYYLGDGMTLPPPPNIDLAQRVQ